MKFHEQMYIIGDSKYAKNEKEQQVESYQTVYRGGMGEIIEKKSRFIAEVYPIESEEQAAQILEETRKKYWDARHHCWAYVLGRNPAAERMSDDGEPAGTAGKPILEVIRGRKLTDVLVIVTRYFGGTLLGTGGLVRAYTSAAIDGLEHSESITRIHGIKLLIRAEYTDLGKIQYLLASRDVIQLDPVYTDKVELMALVPVEQMKGLKADLMEGTNGQVALDETVQCWFAQTEDGIRIFSEWVEE